MKLRSGLAGHPQRNGYLRVLYFGLQSRRRYRNDILAALPDMPVTEKMEDVGIFIRSNKPESYFEDKE